MGLIVPGMTPDTLGEIYEYYPTFNEVRVAAGVFAIGFLVFTLMLKVTVPILLGDVPARADDTSGTLAPAVARS
jgi:molybdopterin-containing oxidoreductase family membrane subunit